MLLAIASGTAPGGDAAPVSGILIAVIAGVVLGLTIWGLMRLLRSR